MLYHGHKSENSYPKRNIYIIVYSLLIRGFIFEVWYIKGIFLWFVFAEEPGPTFATHAVCKTESVAKPFYGKVEVSRPDVPEETHFKGSQLQLII